MLSQFLQVSNHLLFTFFSYKHDMIHINFFIFYFQFHCRPNPTRPYLYGMINNRWIERVTSKILITIGSMDAHWHSQVYKILSV